MTLVAKWLRGFFRKDTMDATAKSEVNLTGGTYNEATDSLEAQQEYATTIKAETALIVADTAELQTEWVDGGRLDLILDTVAVDVAGLDGAAMRGTDGAYTGTPPTAAAIRVEIDSNSTKTGYKLAADGLNSITATTPSSKATTFPQMVVQLYRRFFGKVAKNTSDNTIKNYADNGTTVVTTQTISKTTFTDTQGEAS
jgi:hypothetical protein